MAASTADATTGDERIAQWREHRETERRTARGPSNEHMLADMRGGTKCLFRAADTRLRRMFSKPHGKLVRYHHQLWGFKAVGALRTKMGSRSDTRVFLRRRADLHGRLEPEMYAPAAVYCDSTGKKLAFDRVWRGFWDPARRWRVGQNHRPPNTTHSIAVRDDNRSAAALNASEREAYWRPEGELPPWLDPRFASAFDAFGPGAQPTAWDVPEEPEGLVDEGFELPQTMSIVAPEPPPPPRGGGGGGVGASFASWLNRMTESYPLRPTAEARALDVGMATPMLEPANPESPEYEPTSPMRRATSPADRPASPRYQPTSPMYSPTAAPPVAAAAAGGAWEEYHLDAHGVPHPGPAPVSTAAPAPAACERKDAEAEQCSICLDAPRSHVFAPCGHMTACGACAVRFRKQPCPLCRTKVQTIVKLFKA